MLTVKSKYGIIYKGEEHKGTGTQRDGSIVLTIKSKYGIIYKGEDYAKGARVKSESGIYII